MPVSESLQFYNTLSVFLVSAILYDGIYVGNWGFFEKICVSMENRE
ncbi:hypothetical protein VDG1235_1825 [Verrucomicrobiia bacterium DG1235]|nr:hypothetical protein VDG1235_1825 [Verrucomicrobiae bacterium DG1235]